MSTTEIEIKKLKMENTLYEQTNKCYDNIDKFNHEEETTFEERVANLPIQWTIKPPFDK